MTSPFDPKQIEAQARAFSDKVFSGLNDLLGQPHHSAHNNPDDTNTQNHNKGSQIGGQLDAMRDEVKSALDAQMIAFLQKMNVVTREDYELQQAMMQQTLARVAELERTISALQTELDALTSSNS